MEIEFKFCIPAEKLRAVEAALRRGKVESTRLRARYFDTADQVLAAHGVVLRLRQEGPRWVQTVKATGDNALHRLEHNAELGAVRRGQPAPDINPQRHAGTPVGERLANLLADSGAPLIELQSTDILRLTRDVRVSGANAAVVEVALDVGKVVAHAGTAEERQSPVCELELELKSGHVGGLLALAQRWSQQHGLWFSTVSKAERGARLLSAEPDAPVAAVKAEAPTFAQARDGRAIQQAIVASCLAQMLPNASEIAAGSTDEEQVHQLRIGIRRLRTALRALAELGGDDFDAGAWEPPLVEAFRALGERRDREQIVQFAQPKLREAGAPDFDPTAGDDAGGPLPADVVRAAEFQAVLVGLIGFTAQPADDAAPSLSEGDARDLLSQQLRKLHRQVVADGKRFESLESDAQHRVRKRLKRLRYLAEFAAPLFDAEHAAERYLKHLRPAQDALGAFNDEAVALALYRDAAGRDGRAWFAVGWFSARRAAGATECKAALKEIAGAPKFWKNKRD